MENSNGKRVHIIVGGGPIGLYLSYKLCEKTSDIVIMFEKRYDSRVQVIKVPFRFAKDLPVQVQDEMWADEETRHRIFDPVDINDKTVTWPILGYRQWSFINVKYFQKEMKKFLREQYNFYFVQEGLGLGSDSLMEEIEGYQRRELIPQFSQEQIAAFYCTCGIYRKQLGFASSSGKQFQSKGHGIYLTYKNPQVEHYVRNGEAMSVSETKSSGITYTATNNKVKAVQIYTYPGGPFQDLFPSLPQSFMSRASWTGNEEDFVTLDSVLTKPDAESWFQHYKQALLNELDRHQIELPDLHDVNVFYAERGEYYYEQVVDRRLDRPLFYFGDSAGSTDYKLGLSLGRGVCAVKDSFDLAGPYIDVEELAQIYTNYWKEVIKTEFDQDDNLTAQPWI